MTSDPYDLVITEIVDLHAEVARRLALQPRPTVTPSTVSAARPVPPPAGPDRHGSSPVPVTDARVEHATGGGGVLPVQCRHWWRDGWGYHICHLTDGHEVHRCRCDAWTRRRSAGE